MLFSGSRARTTNFFFFEKCYRPREAKRTGRNSVRNAGGMARTRRVRLEQIVHAFSVERYFQGRSHTGGALTGGRAMCDRPSTVMTREKQDIHGEEN